MKPITILLILTALALHLPAHGQQMSVTDDNGQQVNSIVHEDYTDIVCTSPTNATILRRRTVTILNEKARSQATFVCHCNSFHTLRKFRAIVTDLKGYTLQQLKKSDLQRSEYSNELATDAYYHYYEYLPPRYPFSITWEWEVACSDGLLAFPTFSPMNDYNQQVEMATYRLTTPPDLPVTHHAQNLPTAVRQEKDHKGNLLTTLQATNLTPLQHEPWGPDIRGLLPVAYFVPREFTYAKTQGSQKDWNSFGQWQYSLLQGRDQLPPQALQRLQEETAACTDDLQRVALVYDLLSRTTRYVSIQLGIGGLQPAPAEEVCRTGFGDCKGLSNYARAMLNALGIPATYTVISTENARFTTDFASAGQANHVILQVPLPGDTLWLECTNPRLPLGYVHSDIAGHDALLITPQGGRLQRLPAYPDSLNRQETYARVELTPEGSAHITTRQRATLFQYEAQWPLTVTPPDKQKDYLRSGLSLIQAEVGNIRLQEEKQRIPALTTDYTVESRQYGTRTGKRLFLPVNIFHPSFSVPRMEETRTQDICIGYGYIDSDTIDLQLPQDCVVESLPAPQQCQTPFGSFHASITPIEGNCLRIVHRLHMKQGRHPKEQYADFVNFRKEIARGYGAKIIIRR